MLLKVDNGPLTVNISAVPVEPMSLHCSFLYFKGPPFTLSAAWGRALSWKYSRSVCCMYMWLQPLVCFLMLFMSFFAFFFTLKIVHFLWHIHRNIYIAIYSIYNAMCFWNLSNLGSTGCSFLACREWKHDLTFTMHDCCVCIGLESLRGKSVELICSHKSGTTFLQISTYIDIKC